MSQRLDPRSVTALVPPVTMRIRLAWAPMRARLERVPPRWAAAPVVGIVIGIAISTTQLWGEIWYERGTDYGFFVAQAQRFVDGGGFYGPRQLSGPYAMAIGVDNLYPPPALLLFLPFTLLPGPLWWAVPLGALSLVVLSFRPAPWAWPLIAFACWVPRTQSIVIWGNTTMWIAAFVGLGLRFAWPSILVAVKPYFAPLALIGIRHRSWWVGAALAAALSLVQLPLWADYLTAWRNAGSSWPSVAYSPGDVFMLSIPLIAWVARTRRAGGEPAFSPEGFRAAPPR